MQNYLCAPEMSFSSEKKREPHAYVQYLDDEREFVPTSFIYKLPPKWRSTGWDKNYLFKVFWSPDDEDSPCQMLKRVPEVPVYEKAYAMDKPGYYRATVLNVGESLDELEKLNDGKRVSAGQRQFKYTSFDKPHLKDPKTSRKQPEGKSIKVKEIKDKKVVKKKGGINLTAHTHNTEDLQADLGRKFPHLTEGKCRQDPDNSSDEESSIEHLEPKCIPNAENMVQCIISNKGEQPPEETKHGKNVNKQAVNSKNECKPTKQPLLEQEEHESYGSRTCSKKADTSCSEGILELGFKCQKKTKTWKRDDESTDSPSTDDFYSGGKKMKIDPDYTPRKYEEAKQDLIIQQSTIKRISSLNLRLQEKVIALEAKNEELEGKVKLLEEKLHEFRIGNAKTSTKSQSESNKFSSLMNLEKCRINSNAKRSLAFGGGSPGQVNAYRGSQSKSSGLSSAVMDVEKTTPHLNAKRSLAFGGESPKEVNAYRGSQSKSSGLSSAVMDVEKSTIHLNAKCSLAFGGESPKEVNAYNRGSQSESSRFAPMMDVEKSKVNLNAKHSLAVGGESPKELNAFRVMVVGQFESIVLNTQKDLAFYETKGALDVCDIVMSDSEESNKTPLELCPNVFIEPKFRMIISSIPKGEKRDLRFIKDLAIVSFGPEVLGASSILGTAKGGVRKQSKEESAKIKKPALEKEVLDAVRDKLISRVSMEEGAPVLKPDERPRTTKKRFYDAIRGAQKRVRGLGYGRGEKFNDVMENLLME